MTAEPAFTPRMISLCLGITAIIHLLPLMGLLGADKLQTLYDISIDSPNLAILMRHRAILFGLLGGFLLLAAIKRHLQPLALIGGLISVISFLVLAGMEPGYSAAINKVVMADYIALGCLLLASALHASDAGKRK